ncbi:MAG: MATE family efflux transporter [bacterium]
MTRNNLVVVNMFATYARMILVVGLTLFSSRWILASLGPIDYGLSIAVGGVLAFLSFVNIAMSFSVQRYFAYSIGGGDGDDVNRWFNTALLLHVGVAILLVVIGLPLGSWVLKNVLSIPPERLNTCYYVFYCTVLSCFLNVLSVPFVSMFMAKQRILEFTIISTGVAVFSFLLAYLLLHVSGDRLLFYAVGTLVVQVLGLLAQGVRSVTAFEECRLHVAKGLESWRMKKLLSFTGWSLLSTIAFVLRGQGVVLLLNVYGGPAVNAAFGIANQVSGQAGALSGGLMGAISPEITASEGRGERVRVLNLAMRSCKFATLLSLLTLIPLMVDTEKVLAIWLKEVPPYTVVFCRIMLLNFLANQVIIGMVVATKAFGKIALAEVVSAGVLLMAIPLAYVLSKLGLSVTWVVSSVLITTVACTMAGLWIAKILYGFSPIGWFRDVALRCSVVMILGFSVALGLQNMWEPSFWRFLIITTGNALVLLLGSWLIVFDLEEKNYILQTVRKFRILLPITP